MKKIFVLIILTFQSLNMALADTDFDYQSSAQEIIRLYREMRVGEVSLLLRQRHVTRVSETVVEKRGRSNQKESKGGINLLFLKVGGLQSSSSSSYYDVTRLVVQNAEEVSKFSAQELAQQTKLNKLLLNWIDKNDQKILRLKQYGIAFMLAAHTLVKSDQYVSPVDIQTIASMLLDVNFIGERQVTRCIRTEYANTSSGEKSSDFISLNAKLFGILGGNFSERSSRGSYYRQIAHTETECNSTTNQIKVTAKDSVYMVSYSRLDQALVDWMRAVDQAMLAQKVDILYPTFGSPYFESLKTPTADNKN